MVTMKRPRGAGIGTPWFLSRLHLKRNKAGALCKAGSTIFHAGSRRRVPELVVTLKLKCLVHVDRRDKECSAACVLSSYEA